MENQVLVIGSTCVDVIIRVDHLPHTEENLHPDGQQFAIGVYALVQQRQTRKDEFSP